ncbi:HNH endonuclease, partial [Streptomyces sp. SID5910]|nr:HNH endonuclease [Streptomyces sp. SID5910]
MRRRSRIRTAGAAGAVLTLALVAGCEGLESDGAAPSGGGAAEAPAAGQAASPLRNPDGTEP